MFQPTWNVCGRIFTNGVVARAFAHAQALKFDDAHEGCVHVVAVSHDNDPHDRAYVAQWIDATGRDVGMPDGSVDNIVTLLAHG